MADGFGQVTLGSGRRGEVSPHVDRIGSLVMVRNVGEWYDLD